MLLCAFREADHIAHPLAAELRTTLAPLEDRAFEDGEGKIRPLVPVQGRDVFVVQSLHGDDLLSTHDRLCRLLFLIGTLKDHGAARVTAITPYLCYARKDRRTKPFDPLTLRYVAQMIEAVGCDRVVVVEVHNLMAFQNAFRCQTVHMDHGQIFAPTIVSEMSDRPLTVLSPDPGGIKRAQLFREALATQLDRAVGFAFLDKRRSAGVTTGGTLSGDVAGTRVVIVDDIIATGGTLVTAAEAARAAGAVECVAVAAHGLFLPGASKLGDERAVSRILVSDSIAPRSHIPQIISAAPALAASIRRLSDPSA